MKKLDFRGDTQVKDFIVEDFKKVIGALLPGYTLTIGLNETGEKCTASIEPEYLDYRELRILISHRFNSFTACKKNEYYWETLYHEVLHAVLYAYTRLANSAVDDTITQNLSSIEEEVVTIISSLFAKYHVLLERKGRK